MTATTGVNDPARGLRINVVVLTPVRLLGDGLAACLKARSEIHVIAVVKDLATLRDALAGARPGVVLIDVTQGVDLYDAHEIAAEWPDAKLVALGLREQQRDVIRCGRSGFSGYISRDASIDGVCRSLVEISAGRLVCPPEISGGLLRALFPREETVDGAVIDPALTRREAEVLRLVGRGLSNKEIASELALSVATVKHHVHRILEKLKVPKRNQAMRRVRDAPWIALG
jgi:DNA-binding NarL/FixJ family response regulator